MRRTNFARESEIVGEDFFKVIKKYGGKNAGLLLSQKIWYDNQGYIREKDFKKTPIILKHIPIPVTLYEIAEEILKKALPEPLAQYQEEHRGTRLETQVQTDEEAFLSTDIIKILYEHKNFRDVLEKNVRKCRRAFGKYSQETEYHIRSSTTIEDFVDDRYYGTFETLQRRKSFQKNKRNQKIPLVKDIIMLIQKFYAMKQYTNGFFELESEESLGIMVMPSIPGLHVISYSSYPEMKSSPVIHEVSEIPEKDPEPLALIKVHGNTIDDIEIIPATSDAFIIQDPQENIYEFFPDTRKSRYESKNPFEINGIRSPLSPAEIGELTSMCRHLEQTVSYSVNTESKIVRKDYYSDIYLLQLRPTPVIEHFSPLPPLQNAHYLLAETPFVYGAFSYCAPVLLTEDKNVAREGIAIDKPVIVWDTERNKGHRLFWGNRGDNCLALLNPEEGRTLSHGYGIIPQFGAYRKKFHAIGAPQLKELYRKLELKEYPTDKGSALFGETPFPIIIESDGRSGRISISHEFRELYEKTDNKRKIFERNCEPLF